MADDTTTPPVQGDTPPGASSDAPTAVPADETPVTVQVTSGDTKAQVQGPTPAPVAQIPIHETHVKADQVITDTSSPLAVQVPADGQGDALTPIGRAYANAKTPEDVFAAAASA